MKNYITKTNKTTNEIAKKPNESPKWPPLPI